MGFGEQGAQGAGPDRKGQHGYAFHAADADGQALLGGEQFGSRQRDQPSGKREPSPAAERRGGRGEAGEEQADVAQSP